MERRSRPDELNGTQALDRKVCLKLACVLFPLNTWLDVCFVISKGSCLVLAILVLIRPALASERCLDFFFFCICLDPDSLVVRRRSSM